MKKSLRLVAAICLALLFMVKSSVSIGAQTEGGVLSIGLSANPSTLDPVAYTSQYESNVMRQVLDTLISFDPETGDYTPSLATEWSASEDGMSYDFTIREGVHFQVGEYQDGREVTAEDVKFSLERSAQESAMNRLSGVSEVEVTGDYTVTIHLESPNAALLGMLTDMGNAIIPKEEVEGWGDSFAQNIVGTGPFQISNLQSGQQIELVRNENYWGEKPHLDGVTFKVITDGTMMANSLLSGDIHIATDIKGQNRAIIEQSQNVELMSVPGMATSYLDMNNVTGPTADPKVREAIYMATNVEEIVNGVNQWGGAEVSYSPLPKASWGYLENAKDYIPEFNPEAAKALLAETEYADGFTIELYAAEARVPYATIFQQQMKQNLNITVNINVQEFGTYSQTVASGQAGMNIGGWSWMPDPYFYLNQLFHTDNTTALGNGKGYSVPEVDELLDQALVETDQAARAKLYQEALKIILEDYSRIELELVDTANGVSTAVEGYSVRPDAYIVIVNNNGTNVSLNQ